VPGGSYWFRASFMCNLIDCDGVTSAFVRDAYVLGSGEVVRVFRVRAREFNPNVVSSSGNNRSIIEWSVRYYPTVFPFARHYITHPSPARLLSSAVKTLSQLLRGVEVVLDGGDNMYNAVINNIDLKNIVKDLALNTELINYRIRRLGINLGGGRLVPTFYGTAVYITQTTNPSLLNTLLSTAEFFGVGKNRALGLGFIKITHRDVKSRP